MFQSVREEFSEYESNLNQRQKYLEVEERKDNRPILLKLEPEKVGYFINKCETKEDFEAVYQIIAQYLGNKIYIKPENYQVFMERALDKG